MNVRPFQQFLWVAPLLASAACVSVDTTEAKPPSKRLVCLKYSSFELLEGEEIAGGSGETEDMRLTISRPGGEFIVAEGEVWAPVEGEKELVFSRGQTSVYSVPGDRPIYAIYGPDGDFEDRLFIWLRGSALKGTKEDSEIYERFEIGTPTSAQCYVSFTYSWPNTWRLRRGQD